jgi:transaldolase
MQLFLDSAKPKEIREAVNLGVICGVTTNPSLVAKERVDYKERILEICRIVSGPVSVEVLSQDAEGMIAEAKEFVSWAPNVIVKIPMIQEGLIALKSVGQLKIRTNVTLVFSLNQALLAAIAGADYVSPFVGRLDDVGHDGMKLVAEIVNVYRSYNFCTQVIAASIRHPLHVVQAVQAGAHIATIPFSVLEGMLHHPLTDVGVQRFLDDWQRAIGQQERKNDV